MDMLVTILERNGKIHGREDWVGGEVFPLESSPSSRLRCAGSMIAQALAVAQFSPLGKERDLRFTQEGFPLDLFLLM